MTLSTPALSARPATLAGQIARPGILTDALIVLGGALVTALLAQVSIPLPFTPVPVTLQTLSVLVVGAAAGWKRGALSMALYLVMGIVGLPVFAGWTAGTAFLGATGGYLVGFIASAALVGYLAERGWDRDKKSILAMILGEVVLYLIALPWLGAYVGMGQVLALGFFPFVVGDALKLLVAAGLLPLAWKAVKKD